MKNITRYQNIVTSLLFFFFFLHFYSCGIAHRSAFSHTYSQTCTHQTRCPFFTAGFQLSGEWGRGVQQGSVGSDEDWDGIGWEEPFLLSALLQCCHGTPEGELLRNLKWAYLSVCAKNIVNHRTLLVCRFRHFYPDLYNKYLYFFYLCLKWKSMAIIRTNEESRLPKWLTQT